MTENGTEVSQSARADCLGSPWNAKAWLANTALSHGSPLHAGTITLSRAPSDWEWIQAAAEACTARN